MILRAKYLIPCAGREIENGAVGIRGDKIAAVGDIRRVSRQLSGKQIDFGDACIIPGLVNAHTHLELSDLKGRVPPAEKLTHWLGRLIRARMFWTRWQFRRSTRNGVQQALASGTSTVGDISSTGTSFKLLADGPLRSVVFCEVLGFIPRHVGRNIARVSRRIKRIAATPLMAVGISPHSMYSVSEELYVECQRLAGELNLILCTHLHETEAEIELMTKGTGDFRGLLAWTRPHPEGWKPPGVTPLQRLDELGIIQGRVLLVHCNYLSEADVQVLERRKPSVAFCPRSHAFFGHGPHPFEALRVRGINVCLGTDSLASNDSLSMLDEMRFLVERYGTRPETALHMATVAGGEALGLSSVIGRLERDYIADMAVIGLPSDCEAAHDGIIDPRARTLCTIVSGKVCFSARGEMEGVLPR